MATRSAHAARPGRESLSKRLGRRIAGGIAARDGGVCVYCGARHAGMHLDHLTPRSLGGSDLPSNLALACARCNSARGNMTVSAWAVYAAANYDLTFTARSIRAQARRRLPEVA